VKEQTAGLPFPDEALSVQLYLLSRCNTKQIWFTGRLIDIISRKKKGRNFEIGLTLTIPLFVWHPTQHLCINYPDCTVSTRNYSLPLSPAVSKKFRKNRYHRRMPIFLYSSLIQFWKQLSR
jgi:hypothetical protein